MASEHCTDCDHQAAHGYTLCLHCLHGTCPEINDHLMEQAQQLAVERQRVDALRRPCQCDPIGSGEEFCNGACELRQRAEEMESIKDYWTGRAIHAERKVAALRRVLKDIQDTSDVLWEDPVAAVMYMREKAKEALAAPNEGEVAG